MIELLNQFIQNLRDLGLEKVLRRYYSVYRAEVMENEDPEKRGRIRVKCASLFGEATIEQWAVPRNFTGAAPGRGFFYPPEVGDFVYVEFEGGDTRYPIYSGGWFGVTGAEGAEEDEIPSEFVSEGDAPVIRGFKNKFGHTVILDETEGKETLTVRTPVAGSTPEEFKGHEIVMSSTPDQEMITLSSAAGHLVIMDDTKEKEGVYFIHKSGAQVQMDAKGSVKIISADGSYLAMDAEKGSLTASSKFGSLITMGEKIALADSTGKSLLTLDEKSLQVVTAGDAIIQSNTATMKTGSFVIDTVVAKASFGNGKVALGTPTSEIFDLLGQTVDAILNDPAPYMTGTGPTSPLIGASKAQLTIVKSLIAAVKGSIS